MDFKEYIESQMTGKVLTEAFNVDVNKTNKLIDIITDLYASGTLPNKLSEESAKVMTYLIHLRAAAAENYKNRMGIAATSLQKDKSGFENKQKSILAKANIPEELWFKGPEE